MSTKTPETSEERANACRRSPLASQDAGEDPAQHDAISLLDLERADHRGGIESERSDYSDDSVAINNEPDEGNNGGDGASGHGGDDDEAKDAVSAVIERDPEAEVELVTMLDESLSNFPNIRPPVIGGVTASEETDDHGLLSARTEASNQSAEYDDNNFDDDEAAADGEESIDDELQTQPEVVAKDEGEESDPADEGTNPTVEVDGLQSVSNEPASPPAPATTHDGDEDGNIDHDEGEEEPHDESHDEQHDGSSPQRPGSIPSKAKSAQQPREMLLDELEKWARAPQARVSLLVGSAESLEWQATDALEAAVRDNASPVIAAELTFVGTGRILAGATPPTAPLVPEQYNEPSAQRAQSPSPRVLPTCEQRVWCARFSA